MASLQHLNGEPTNVKNILETDASRVLDIEQEQEELELEKNQDLMGTPIQVQINEKGSINASLENTPRKIASRKKQKPALQ